MKLKCKLPLNKEEVDQLSRTEICRCYRFLPVDTPENWEKGNKEYTKLKCLVFDRYQQLGGMTPEISKSIGL